MKTILVLSVFLAIYLSVVATAQSATCDPPCTVAGQQCAVLTDGPNKCVDILYGSCSQTSDCPKEDGFTLTCFVDQCVPTQFFNFSCSAANPCTSPDVCTNFEVPSGTDGWCVPAGSLYAPCTATSDCMTYNTTLITIECSDSFCQIAGVAGLTGSGGGTPCTSDAQCLLSCDLSTNLCITLGGESTGEATGAGGASTGTVQGGSTGTPVQGASTGTVTATGTTTGTATGTTTGTATGTTTGTSTGPAEGTGPLGSSDAFGLEVGFKLIAVIILTGIAAIRQ